jgi:hypothetical protein
VSRPSLRPTIDPARRRPSSLGRGWFTDDIRVADAAAILYVARLRSPHAHARIRSVSVDRAIKMQPNSRSPAPSTSDSAHDTQAESVAVSLSARRSSATSASRRARHHVCALALGHATPGIAGIASADIYKV